MANVRFTQLVKVSGNPATELLWEKPEQNQSFMRAVKQNRILTIFQKAGSQPDVGKIGFHEAPHATYLIFPKPLPKASEARVIGIHYDLVREPAVKNAGKPAPARVRKEPAKPAPVEFEIEIERRATIKTTIVVSAATKHEAEKLALERIEHQPFQPPEIHNSVKSIRPS